MALRNAAPMLLLALIALLHEMRLRRIPVTPGWRKIVARLRPYAERGGAAWALAELAKAED